jgi:hypothetical protein
MPSRTTEEAVDELEFGQRHRGYVAPA